MYSWDIESVKRLLKYYKQKYKQTSNPCLQEQIENTINSIYDILNYYNKHIQKQKTQIPHPKKAKALNTQAHMTNRAKSLFHDIIYYDLELTKDFGEYFPIVRRFAEEFNYNSIQIDENLSKIRLPNRHIVTMSETFYHQCKGIFSETFDHLSSRFPTHLNFRKPEPNLPYGGQTMAIYNTDQIFIDIVKAGNFQDFITMIHESSHGITNLLNPNIIEDSCKYAFLEVDAIFFELIGGESVSQKLNKDTEIHQIKLATFKDYLYSANLICSKADTYARLSRRELNNPKLVRHVCQEFGYSKIYIQDILQSYMHDFFHYVIAYLTAIELYLIYQEDSEYALDLVHKIIMLKEMNQHDYLKAIKKLGINPGANTKKYYDMLIKQDHDLCNGHHLRLKL